MRKRLTNEEKEQLLKKYLGTTLTSGQIALRESISVTQAWRLKRKINEKTY